MTMMSRRSLCLIFHGKVNTEQSIVFNGRQVRGLYA